jgi:hypothetical protein
MRATQMKTTSTTAKQQSLIRGERSARVRGPATRCAAMRRVASEDDKRLLITVLSAATVAMTTLSAHAEVTCNVVTPCTPPPPNGGPRYELPGTTYDPAKEATERYLAKLAKEAEARAPVSAPAVEVETTTTASE